MPGRKPTPTAIRMLHGNPQHRPLNKSEPNFGCNPVCPDFLTAEAKQEWDRIISELSSVGLLQSTDQAALAAYCLSFGRWMTAEKIVTAQGQTVEEPVMNKAGEIVGTKVRRHPATTIAREERSAMLKAAALFGFDPSSRSRIVMPEAKAPPVHDDIESNLFADDPQDTGGIVH